jgi:MarC family membrane protein
VTGIDDGAGAIMQRAKLIGDAITLLVVIDPISVVPLFLALTRGLPRERRRRVARRGVVIAGAILLSFIAVGEIVLDALKITLPAFRVAGGLVLLLVALKMVLQDEHRRGAVTDDGTRDGPDVAVFPLAMPFIAGPGAIIPATVGARHGGRAHRVPLRHRAVSAEGTPPYAASGSITLRTIATRSAGSIGFAMWRWKPAATARRASSMPA